MSDPVGGDHELELGGVERESVCSECVFRERVEYASSMAESLVVFMNRVRAGETGMSRPEILGLGHHFLEVMLRRECPWVDDEQ